MDAETTVDGFLKGMGRIVVGSVDVDMMTFVLKPEGGIDDEALSAAWQGEQGAGRGRRDTHRYQGRDGRTRLGGTWHVTRREEAEAVWTSNLDGSSPVAERDAVYPAVVQPESVTAPAAARLCAGHAVRRAVHFISPAPRPRRISGLSGVSALRVAPGALRRLCGLPRLPRADAASAARASSGAPVTLDAAAHHTVGSARPAPPVPAFPASAGLLPPACHPRHAVCSVLPRSVGHAPSISPSSSQSP